MKEIQNLVLRQFGTRVQTWVLNKAPEVRIGTQVAVFQK